MKYTKGRRHFNSCGHAGFGKTCNRCSQSFELEARANELAQVVKTKNKDLPEFATWDASSKVIKVKGGGRSFSVLAEKGSREAALGKLVQDMRAYATHLVSRPSSSNSA